VRDHVVQLARDPPSLDRHRRPRLQLPLFFQFPIQQLELAAAPPPAAHDPADQPRRGQPHKRRHHVPARLTVYDRRDEKPRGDRRQHRGREHCLAPLGTTADRIGDEHERHERLERRLVRGGSDHRAAIRDKHDRRREHREARPPGDRDGRGERERDRQRPIRAE
jgi:hypothetical protein